MSPVAFCTKSKIFKIFINEKKLLYKQVVNVVFLAFRPYNTDFYGVWI